MFSRSHLPVIGVALLVGISVVYAQTTPLNQPPAGQHVLIPPQDPCELEVKAAVGAVKLRDEGRSEKELAEALPARGTTNNQLAEAMYSILDDVYGNPSVQTFPYYTYRMLICHARLQGMSVPNNFSVVASGVLACQKQFGANPSDSLINCIRKATFTGNAS
jgi:hypothetical protein